MPCFSEFEAVVIKDGNLIHDSGFEMGKEISSFETSGSEMRDVMLNRWNSFGFNCAGIFGYDRRVVSTSSDIARTGKKSAKLLLDKEAGFFQDVKSQPGKAYIATFYYQSPELNPATEDLKFMIVAGSVGYNEKTLHSETVSVNKATLPGEWAKIQVRLVCPKEANIISPHVRYQPKTDNADTGKKAVYVDDVSLEVE
jgi:hypothetical protein